MHQLGTPCLPNCDNTVLEYVSFILEMIGDDLTAFGDVGDALERLWM
jgi:hypothetical protein